MRAWVFSLGTHHHGKIVAFLLFLSFTLAGATQLTPPNTPASPLATNIKPIPKTKPAPSTAKTGTKSDWNTLTPTQQLALAPLAAEWNKLDSYRKERWLALANKFASMSPADQVRMQERMRAWVRLSPEQRRAARERYARAEKLNTEQKARQWAAYQQLSEEQKKQLAATVSPKKPIVNLPRPHSEKNATQAKPASKHIPTKQPLPQAEAIGPSPVQPSLPAH